MNITNQTEQSATDGEMLLTFMAYIFNWSSRYWDYENYYIIDHDLGWELWVKDLKESWVGSIQLEMSLFQQISYPEKYLKCKILNTAAYLDWVECRERRNSLDRDVFSMD